MASTIFYSWQSQLPNSTNRGFIQGALEAAARAVRDDTTIDVRPEVDQDTANVPGSPNIADTIRAKIDAAEIAVFDVSIVQGLDGDGDRIRPTPNANVLIELGYAMKSLGTMARVVLVMNTAYGDISKLPFDLRQYRPATYNLPDGTQDKAEVKKALAAQLEKTLRHVLAGPSRHVLASVSLLNETIQSVENAAPNAELLTKRHMGRLVAAFIKCAPAWQQDGGDIFIAGIASTVPLMAEFARLASAVVDMNNFPCARAIYDGLIPLVERYDAPRGYAGAVWRTEFDFFKFLGHELLVTFTAAVVREERWELLDDVLRRELFVEYGTGPKALVFTDLWGDVHVLDQRSERDRRLSVHADLLKERHSAGELGELTPFDRFVDADTLLFLRGELMQPAAEPFKFWFPHSVVYLAYRQPSYLIKGERAEYCAKLLKGFGCDSIENMRMSYASRRAGWGRFYERGSSTPPLLTLNLAKLATR